MMTSVELQQMLNQAAELGAKRALEKVGLHDDGAGEDVRELRGLLESWRDTKKTVGQTITRIITTGILAVLATGLWMHWNNK